ncbi:hypothetical protein P9112_002971 [Eukaryota sp. TZLM1-RC]
MANIEKKLVLGLNIFSTSVCLTGVLLSILHRISVFHYGMNLWFAITASLLCSAHTVSIYYRYKHFFRITQTISFITLFFTAFTLYFRILSGVVPPFIEELTNNIVITGSVFVALLWASLGSELYIHSLPVIDLEFFPDARRGNGTKDSEPEEGEEEDSRHPCIICFSRGADSLFLPCAHLICCHECGRLLSSCPVCRRPISRINILPSVTRRSKSTEETAVEVDAAGIGL